MDVEFYLSDNIKIKINHQPENLPDDSNDKYLLFKYFGIKYKLFGIFLYLTEKWFQRDLEILINQIIGSFNNSFGSFTMFENECVNLLCTGSIVLMNHGHKIIHHAIKNNYYRINSHILMEILTRMYFRINEYRGSHSDVHGWTYFINLQHEFTQNPSLFNTYQAITRDLISYCDEKFNVSKEYGSLMPWCKNQWISFAIFLEHFV